MVQKTYFKTKDYCKVKFSFNVENAETIEILGTAIGKTLS
jgi:hypothetical protein